MSDSIYFSPVVLLGLENEGVAVEISSQSRYKLRQEYMNFRFMIAILNIGSNSRRLLSLSLFAICLQLVNK